MQFYNFSCIFVFQARECTVPLNGSGSIAIMAAQQPSGLWEFCCLTWFAEIFLLNKTIRSWKPKSASGEDFHMVSLSFELLNMKIWLLLNIILKNYFKFYYCIAYNILLFWFSEVKDLIKKCLSIRPSDRPSLEDILSHPWLAPAQLSVDKLAIRTPSNNNMSSTGSVDGESMSSQESIW